MRPRSSTAGARPADTTGWRVVRHQRDRAREATAAFPYRLDLRQADRFLAFGQLLKHYKGHWAGTPIAWEAHQVFRLGSLFGWIDLRYRPASVSPCVYRAPAQKRQKPRGCRGGRLYDVF